MGFSCNIKSLRHFIVSNLGRLITSHKNHTHTNTNDFHPSPSLVPLPFHLISSFNKNHLPVVQYTMLDQRSRSNHDEEDEDGDRCRCCCAVCLSSVEPLDNVRELCNCRHVFHVNCLDSWIECGHNTCPVCRAKLSSGHGEELGPGKDPWRSQRMVYLFGEDCHMEELD
ncbi:hypothetical protein ACS0TY_000272 [Phlomoides rotata]